MHNKTTAERLEAIATSAMQGILASDSIYAQHVMREGGDCRKKEIVSASFTLAKMLLEKIDNDTADPNNQQ